MVRIATGQHAYVQRQTRMRRDGLEDVPGERTDVRAADDHVLLPLRLAGVDAVMPPGDVDGALHECLVEWHQRVAEATDAALVAQRLVDRLAERDRDEIGERRVGKEGKSRVLASA